MTLRKAQHVVERVVAEVTSPSAVLVRRMSELGGYDLEQIQVAMKLCVARDYLACSRTPSALTTFRKQVDRYDAVFVSLPCSFVPDGMLDKFAHQKPDSREHKQAMLCLVAEWCDHANPAHQRWVHSETITSFGRFCEHVGSHDAQFWPKVFAHLELPYEGTSSLEG